MQGNIEERLDRFKQRLKVAGVKITHQRVEIFREVVQSKAHPDAEMVFREVAKRVSGVSIDTVYRTLRLLEDLGLIARMGCRNESVRFDGNLDPHHHFVCIRCGLARDFEADAAEGVHLPASIGGIGDVLLTRLEVQGVCRACIELEDEMARTPLARRIADKGSRRRGL